jgi:hypothetical protein
VSIWFSVSFSTALQKLVWMFVAQLLVFFLGRKCQESAAQGLVQVRKGRGWVSDFTAAAGDRL